MNAILPILILLLAGTAFPASAEESLLEYHAALGAMMDRDTTIGAQAARVRSTRAGQLPNRMAFLPSVSA